MEVDESAEKTEFLAPEEAAMSTDASNKAVPSDQRTTTRFLTKYERARVLGTRALQISMNAPVMVQVININVHNRVAGSGSCFIH